MRTTRNSVKYNATQKEINQLAIHSLEQLKTSNKAVDKMKIVLGPYSEAWKYRHVLRHNHNFVKLVRNKALEFEREIYKNDLDNPTVKEFSKLVKKLKNY